MRKSSMITLGILAILMVFLSGYTFAVLTTSKEVGSSANVVRDIHFTIYENDYTLVEVTFIDWENITPTQVKTKDVWIQNDVELPMNISVSTKDLNANISFSYAEGVGWDNGMYPQLNPHQKVQLLLTLTPNENCIEGTVSFVIVFSGVAG